MWGLSRKIKGGKGKERAEAKQQMSHAESKQGICKVKKKKKIPAIPSVNTRGQ